MTIEGSHVPELRGDLDGTGARIAIVWALFNRDITSRLLDGAREGLFEHGVDREDGVDVYPVPGAWELPQAAARILELERHDAVIALGCVIRGETPHFEYVCAEANRGLGAIARASRVPVLFGVLTTDDHAQALARAGEGPSNKGYETAMAALHMIGLYRRLAER